MYVLFADRLGRRRRDRGRSATASHGSALSWLIACIVLAAGLAAFAASWYFRKEAMRDVKSFLLKGDTPALRVED